MVAKLQFFLKNGGYLHAVRSMEVVFLLFAACSHFSQNSFAVFLSYEGIRTRTHKLSSW